MLNIKFLYYQLKNNFELICWSGALVLLAVCPINDHIIICPFRLLSIVDCPGCGISRSMSSILHGNFVQSWHYHPLGLFALIVLLSRILVLVRSTKIIKPLNQ
nr:DUF2752 domain-containing protein [Bacteroidota bacterium]